MIQMTVPEEAIKYILFQRTAYQLFPHTFAYRMLKKILPFSIYNRAVEREARTDSSRIKAMYEDDMWKEYQSLQRFLPHTCNSILDIGCGVAGIDVFLSKHYKDNQPIFYLLDKTDIEDKVFYDFKHRGAFYNSLDVAKATLIANGVQEKNVNAIEAADNNDINIDSKIDLVISLISWGFHYPVATYLERVRELLNIGGSLIIDVRKDTGDIELLDNAFGKIDIIFDEKKFQRILATN